jgi:hypothetical protein
MPGLSPGQARQLLQALEERAALAGEDKARYPVPEPLARSFAGQVWWALMQELSDRPLTTVLGLLASATYPVWWFVQAAHRWF